MALIPDIDTFYYSTAIAYEDISFQIARAHGIHFIDYAAATNMLPAGVRAIEVGYDANRPEKTAVLFGYPITYRHLDVCTNQNYQAERGTERPLNCGKCAKCLRTIAALDYQGALDRYASLFFARYVAIRQTAGTCCT